MIYGNIIQYRRVKPRPHWGLFAGNASVDEG